MKYLLYIFAALLLLSLVSAGSPENPDDTFKVNTKIDYKKPCFNNGTYCSSSATCNLTVTDQANTVLVNNRVMTNKGAYFNYTIGAYSTLGVYKADMICNDAGLMGSETFYYRLTPSGNFSSGTTIALYFLIILVIYGVTFFGFFGRNEWVTVIGAMGMIILGLYTINNGIIIYRDAITDVFSWTTIGLGAFFAIFTGVSAINENM